METSIRFLRIERRGLKPALCFRGRNQAHAVINDEGCIRAVSHIPIKQHDEAKIVLGPVGLGHTIYPVELFCRRFEEIGKRKPITLRAAYFLKRALEGGVADDEVLPPDELPGTEPMKKQADSTPYARLAEAIMHPERSPKPGKPGKPPVAPPKAVPGAVKAAATGGTLVARLAAEFKLEPPKLRKILRAAGLRAPYDDKEAQIRAVLK